MKQCSDLCTVLSFFNRGAIFYLFFTSYRKVEKVPEKFEVGAGSEDRESRLSGKPRRQQPEVDPTEVLQVGLVPENGVGEIGLHDVGWIGAKDEVETQRQVLERRKTSPKRFREIQM